MVNGDDLLQYLIVPGPQSTTASTSKGPRQDGSKDSSEVRRSQGKLQDLHQDTPSGDMEIDTPAVLTLMPSANVEEKVNGLDQLDGAQNRVYNLEAYMAAHPPPAAKSTPKTTPKPTTSEDAGPRPLGSRSSKYTIELHQKHQALGTPKPEFFITGSGDEGFSGKVVFAGILTDDEDGNGDVVVEDEDEGFGSKQGAKENLSMKALRVLEKLEGAGRLTSKKEKKKKRKENASMQNEDEGEEKSDEPVVNYIGQLLEFQNSTSSPAPTYHDFKSDSGTFSCTLEIDGLPNPFGSETTFFSSKKAAHRNAARCAIDHFKSTGAWPDTFTHAGGIRKKKKKAIPPSSDAPSTTAGNGEGAGNAGNGNSAPSHTSQLSHLASTLSLSTPSYTLTSWAPKAPHHYTATCHFKNGGALAGPLGRVDHIHGKKRAKEECARLTMVDLLKVKEKRLERGKRMLREMEMEMDRGDAEGGGVGVGVAVSEDEDGFEDAVEHVGR